MPWQAAEKVACLSPAHLLMIAAPFLIIAAPFLRTASPSPHVNEVQLVERTYNSLPNL